MDYYSYDLDIIYKESKLPIIRLSFPYTKDGTLKLKGGRGAIDTQAAIRGEHKDLSKLYAQDNANKIYNIIFYSANPLKTPIPRITLIDNVELELEEVI